MATALKIRDEGSGVGDEKVPQQEIREVDDG